DRGNAGGREGRGHQSPPRAPAARLVDSRDWYGANGRRPANLGDRSLLPSARREERLHRRRRAVRLRRHAEHHLVDPGDGVADLGLPERASEGGARVINRRTFLQSVAAGVVLTSVRPAGQASPRKAVLISMLPKELPYAQRFKIARDAGFDAIEMQTIASKDEAAEIREAAEKTGLRIHSVMNMDHWSYPRASSDREAVDRSVAGMEASLRNAALWGADTVLLVPGVVDATTSYQDAWTRSQRVIRERLLPLGRDLKGGVAVG